MNIPFPKDLGRPEKYGFARQFSSLSPSHFGAQIYISSVQDEELPPKYHRWRVTGSLAYPVRVTLSVISLILKSLWFRPQSVYRQAIADTTDHAKETLFAPLRPFEEEVFESSLRKRDTVIYFHGNVSNDSHIVIISDSFHATSGMQSSNSSSRSIMHGIFEQARCVSLLIPPSRHCSFALYLSIGT